MSENHDILALRAALRSPKQHDKLKAIHTLGELHEISAVPDLLDVLYDNDHIIRWAAATALEKMGDKTALKGLIAELDSDNREVRQAAVGSLRRMRNVKAVSALIDRLMQETEDTIRREIIEALGVIGDTSAVPTLVAGMQTGREHGERVKAIRALGDMGDSSVVPDLVAILREPNSELRGEAASALAKIGDKSVVPDLLKVLREGNPSFYVICAISTLGDARVVPDLVAALAKADNHTRPFLIEALDKIGDTVALSALVQQLTFDDRKFGSRGRRIYALAEAALKRIGTLSAVEQWRKANRFKLLRHRVQDTMLGTYDLLTDAHTYPLVLLGVAIIVIFLLSYFVDDAPLWQSILIALSFICFPIFLMYGIFIPIGMLRTWIAERRK
jgi:HEAT repeat protein